MEEFDYWDCESILIRIKRAQLKTKKTKSAKTKK